MRLETDIKKMAEMARERFDENWRFRSFLKGYDADVEEIDATVHEIYREVSAQIDCTACANCCRVVSPILNMADIQRFSEGLGISVSKMMAEHIARHEKSDRFQRIRAAQNRIRFPLLI